MRHSEVANRYAQAIYDLAKAANSTEKIYDALKAVSHGIHGDQACEKFVASPLISATEKEAVFKKIMAAQNVTGEVAQFITLLAKKGRLELLGEIIAAYQACDDKVKSITRGTVKSPAPLSEKQKSEITQTIAGITKKNVILSFEEDKSLIGGLVAQVGSLTFDDSLVTHLGRIKDELNRRMN